jgi:Glycosyl hydrolase catalytic core
MMNKSKITRRSALGILGAATATLPNLIKADYADSQLVIRQTPDSGYLGLNVGTELNWLNWRDKLLPLYQSAEVSWLRVWYNWASLEPTRGEFGDPLTLESLRMAKEMGFRLLFVVWGTPPHAGTGELNAIPQTSALQRYCYWLRDNLGDVVDAWEIGNEPNLDKYYAGGSASNYVATLATAYFILRDVGQVVAAGPSGAATTSYWDALVDAGMERYCHRVNIHPYRTLPENVISVVDSFRQRVRKPIWITELGLDTASGGETAKAAFLSTVLPLLETRVEKVFWYRSIQGEGVHPLNYGLVSLDSDTGQIRTLPAYNALVNYARAR